MDESIWTPGGDDASDGPTFVHATVPEHTEVTRELINKLAADAWALRMEDRERAAYIIAWHTLPRGLKWAVKFPKLLKALKRLRVWKPPAMNWLPMHPNCRCVIVPRSE